MHAESLHGPEGAGNTAVAHVPHHVMRRFGVQRHEVPERVVGGLRLRDLPIRLRLGGVDDVGELDAVLNEEHRHVVSDQVEGALVGVELHREPAGVADRVGRPSGAEHGRKTGEHFGFRALLTEEPGLGHRRCVAVGLEHTVRGGTAGVHHALRDALVVEVGDLLPQVKVLQQRRAASARLQRVIGVRQAQTLGRGQKLTGLGPWIRVGALAVRDAGRAGWSGSTLVGFARRGHVKSPGNRRGAVGACTMAIPPSFTASLTSYPIPGNASGIARTKCCCGAVR